MMNSVSMPNAYTASSLDIFDTNTMTWNSIIGYSIAILLIVLVLLLFINYTITPIFQLMPGGPGFIPVPFANTSESYWKPETKPYTVPDITTTKVDKMAGGWAMSLDICIMDVSQRTSIKNQNGFRLIFNRGGSLPESANIRNDGSISSVIKGYNIIIGLLKDTNDLIVSMRNDKQNPENIILTNVPTQTPFRLGVNIMDSAFEVYMNGKLAKIRSMASSIPLFASAQTPPLFQGPGQFDAKYNTTQSQASALTKMVRVGNLILWNHQVLPSVMKNATPALMPLVPSMDSVATGSLCGTSSDSVFSSLTSGLSGLSTAAASNLSKAQQTARSQGVQDALTTLQTENSYTSMATNANSLFANANSLLNNPR
jgi:hypothetical protein